MWKLVLHRQESKRQSLQVISVYNLHITIYQLPNQIGSVHRNVNSYDSINFLQLQKMKSNAGDPLHIPLSLPLFIDYFCVQLPLSSSLPPTEKQFKLTYSEMCHCFNYSQNSGLFEKITVLYLTSKIESKVSVPQETKF